MPLLTHPSLPISRLASLAIFISALFLKEPKALTNALATTKRRANGCDKTRSQANTLQSVLDSLLICFKNHFNKPIAPAVRSYTAHDPYALNAHAV